MRSALLVGSTARPAEVHGVHGAAGLTNWTCFARRAGLDGTWEAIEWASVPRGGVSGEHRHTRTEEIYFILSGEADMYLDGVAHPVTAGDLVLTTVGTRHALHNTGTAQVDWLVIEMLSPHTAWVLDDGGAAPPVQGGNVKSTVVNLREVGHFDPRGVFAGPLELVGLETLEPGAELDLVAEGREHTVFVVAGSGTGTSGPAGTALEPGTSVTVPHGGALRVSAGPDGLTVFRAAMAVRPGRAS